MHKNKPPRRPSDPESPDPSTEHDDDAVIARVVNVSALALLAVLAVAALGYWATHRSVRAPEDIDTVVVLPDVRETAPVQCPAIRVVDIAAASGIDFVHTDGAAGEKLLPETMGGGCAFLDYDQDGDQDLLFVNGRAWPWDDQGSSPPTSTVALYANDGKGSFTNVTNQAGLDVLCYGMGVACGDYDNDGDVDLFVSAVGENILLRNDLGRFVDVTARAGVAGNEAAWSTSCGWFDVENDGDLDLIVGNYVTWSRELDLAQDFRLTGIGRAYGPPFSFEGAFPFFYRNNGDGTFTDASVSSGFQITTDALDLPLSKTLGIVITDVNRDGFLDVLMANDTARNLLFLNQKDGTFREAGIESGIAYDSNGKARGAMGIDAAYFRNDGALGVAIANFANEMTALYVDEGATGVFTDDAIPTGLGPPTRQDLSFGLFFFDVDLDGRLDLFSANGHLEEGIERIQKSQRYRQPPKLFWNAGQGTGDEFVVVELNAGSADNGLMPMVGRGAAYADIDGDGDLDMVVTQVAGPPALLRNDQQTGNHFVRLQLRGTDCNRDAIGAVVELEVGGQVLRRQVMPTRSYLSQVELPITIGIGSDPTVDRLTVIWPDGQKQVVKNYVIDAGTTIQQDQP